MNILIVTRPNGTWDLLVDRWDPNRDRVAVVQEPEGVEANQAVEAARNAAGAEGMLAVHDHGVLATTGTFDLLTAQEAARRAELRWNASVFAALERAALDLERTPPPPRDKAIKEVGRGAVRTLPPALAE